MYAYETGSIPAAGPKEDDSFRKLVDLFNQVKSAVISSDASAAESIDPEPRPKEGPMRFRKTVNIPNFPLSREDIENQHL